MSGLALHADAQLGATHLDVRLDVPAGRCLALAGPSGAGKTSVLRTIAGLLRPRVGRVTCGGETWLDVAAGVWRTPDRRRCGYLFQDYALFPHLRGWQNVAYPLVGVPRPERRRRASALLERFGVGHLADARPATYSGGERQRVALARTLARDPLVLLLDEPISALDARTSASAVRELQAVLRDSAIPTVLVTHDFAEAALLGDEIAVIDSGAIVQRGSASELAAAPASGFVADFTGAVVLTGTASAGPDGLTAIALGDGHEVVSTDALTGPVAVSIYPWEISLAPPGGGLATSQQNRLPATVVSVTEVGNRRRVALDSVQPLLAEVTDPGVRVLDLAPGRQVDATWKAAATRLIPR